MELKYKLINADKDGNPYGHIPVGDELYIHNPKCYTLIISEEVSNFMDNMCDIQIFNGHTKVYILNNQRFIKEPVFFNNSLTFGMEKKS